MSAIKNFFKQNRERETRAEERRAQRRAEIEKKRQERIEQMKKDFEEEFYQIDTLLRDQDFTNEELLIEYIWDQYDDVFNKIMENIKTYPDNVQEILTNAFNRPTFATGKIKLVELSDEDMERLEKEKQKEIETKIEAEWQQYKKDQGMTRPEGKADEKYTELYETLQKTKKDLEEEEKKPNPNKKYVPIHLRGKTPEQLTPEVEKLKKKIQDTENEIVKVKKEIEKEEYNWENDKRKEATTYLYNKVFGV